MSTTSPITSAMFRTFDPANEKTTRSYATRERLDKRLAELFASLHVDLRGHLTLVPLITAEGRHTALFLVPREHSVLLHWVTGAGFAVSIG